MALGDTGMFNPAESHYLTPGAYGETLKAEALKRASYLSSMDQFYEQLDETVRQFNETLTFKEAALAQEKWAVEQNIGVQRESIAMQKSLGWADITLRTRAMEEEVAYKGGSLDMEKQKIAAEAASDVAWQKLMRDRLAQTAPQGTTPATQPSGPSSGAVTTQPYSSQTQPYLSLGFYGNEDIIPGYTYSNKDFGKSAGQIRREYENPYDPGASEYA